MRELLLDVSSSWRHALSYVGAARGETLGKRPCMSFCMKVGSKTTAHAGRRHKCKCRSLAGAMLMETGLAWKQTS